MKNLSITIIFLSTLVFGSTAFAKGKKNSKVVKTTTTTRTVKNVRPNTKVKKVKVVKSYKNSKAKAHKSHRKGPKYTTKLSRKRGHYRAPRHTIGARYKFLPGRPIRVFRRGRIMFYSQGAFFRPFYKHGKKRYVVVR